MVGGHARGGVCVCVCVCERAQGVESHKQRGPHSSDNEPAISLSIPCLGLVMREIN